MSETPARTLYLLIADVTEGDAPAPDFEELAEATRAKLKSLSAVLYRAYEAARRQGDRSAAATLNALIGRIEILWIALNQELIRLIDQSPDVAEAIAKFEAINTGLTDEADRAARSAADAKRISGVLDGLTKVIGWVKDKTDDA